MSNTPAARLARLKQENPRWEIARTPGLALEYIAVLRSDRRQVIRVSLLTELENRLLREKRLGGSQ